MTHTAFSAGFFLLFLGQDGAAASQAETWQEVYAAGHAANLRSGIGGWNVLSDVYREPNPMDGLSLEWDYFSIHDHGGKFTGVVAYLVVDPEGHLGSPEHIFHPNLMPSGANITAFGRIGATGRAFAHYIPFGLDYQASASDRSFSAANEHYYGFMTPVPGRYGEPDRLILEGKTKDLEWKLTVSQLWAGQNSERGYGDPNFAQHKNSTWVVGKNMFPTWASAQHWTVNMLWPSTKVDGWMIDRATGETMTIDGHGYRENSFGRWAFAAGGWDFYFMSDVKNQVQWAFQSYHPETPNLDYLDVDFVENGKPVSARFSAQEGQLGWYHGNWKWTPDTWQCRPTDAMIVGKNETYTVTARVENGDDYGALLSTATPATSVFQITVLFPVIKGLITRNDTGEAVSVFSGQGGGEFSLLKSPIPLTDTLCNLAMRDRFKAPIPQ